MHLLSFKDFSRRKFFSPDFYKSLNVEICRMSKFSPTVFFK